jgi:hypothetical protein
MRSFILIFLCLIGTVKSAYPHGDHHHVIKEQSNKSEDAVRITRLTEVYTISIKPIFEKKCFDCHSSTTHYPWYHHIPGVKQVIDSDISEAKEHLDMSNGFPFNGHGTLDEDLTAIEKAIVDKTMPPFRYRLLHPSAAISDEDRAVILKWVQSGKK